MNQVLLYQRYEFALGCCYSTTKSMVGGLAFKGRLMDKIPDAEYKVVEHQIAPATRPLSALAISTTFLSKMARTNEEQQLKANSYLW